MVRRSSTETFQRLEGIRDAIVLHTGDLLDQRSLVDVLRETEPDEIYNLAAMSFVAASWNQPVLTAEFTGVGVTRILEAMREVRPEARFYQASSSEMFGKVLRGAPARDDPLLPALALRRGQGLRPLHHGQLPRVVRPFCLLRDTFQPRVFARATTSDGARERRSGGQDAPGSRGAAREGPERPDVRARRPARGVGRRGLDAGSRDHGDAAPRRRSGSPPGLDPGARRRRRWRRRTTACWMPTTRRCGRTRSRRATAWPCARRCLTHRCGR